MNGIARRSVIVLLASCIAGCRGDLARWTGRSEGTIDLAVGMTRQEAQRRSTIKLNEYGDSGRFFDLTLAGESITFPGCVQYMLSTRNGRIDMVSVASANETWPDLLRHTRQTETLLLSRGWRRDPRTRTIASLPPEARQAHITESGAIDAFGFYKGNVSITITPSGLWGGIPKWRRANHAKVFWRGIAVSLMDAGEMESLANAR